MARKASTIEYLERLVEWAGNRADFCRLTGIGSGNLSDYLNARKPISWKRLHRCTSQVFGEPPAFKKVIEGFEIMFHGLPSKKDLPSIPGIYALFDSAMRTIYYGKATNLYTEIRQALNRKVHEVRPWNGKKGIKFSDITAYVSAYQILRGDAVFRHDLESLCHRMFVNNTFNIKSGSFKRDR
jgi:hypothetical protein